MAKTNCQGQCIPDTKGGLKLKIPIIPALIEYETSLDWNIQAMVKRIWKDLKSVKFLLNELKESFSKLELMMSAKYFIEKLNDTISFEMVYVEGGSFMMGRQDDEADEYEKPVHKVTLSGFYIGKFQVTQDVWKAMMENNPSRFQGDDLPVEEVSWDDTQAFLEKLNGKTGKNYRLLSEAEWEYAARGGQKSQGYKYAGSNKLKDVGWYNGNSYGATKPVGLKYPNELGIYDMSGNVWEWVADHWHDNYESAPDDSSAWVDRDKRAFRVIRGGGWASSARNCRVAFRSNLDPSYRNFNVGFRLGLSR